MKVKGSGERGERNLSVKWGHIQTESRMEAKLGRWSRRPMPKMLKVN